MKKFTFSSLLGITLACFTPTAFAELVTVGFEKLTDQINANGGAWSNLSNAQPNDGVTFGTPEPYEHHSYSYGSTSTKMPFTVDGVTFYSHRHVSKNGPSESWVGGTGLSTKTDGNPQKDTWVGSNNWMASITRSGYESSAYGVIRADSFYASVMKGGSYNWETEEYSDLAGWTAGGYVGFDPKKDDDRPVMTFEKGTELISMMVTNTSYTASSMLYNQEYATFEPGGLLNLLIYGYDSEGKEVGVIRQNLGNSTGVLDEWALVDLTKLSGATELRFAFEGDEYDESNPYMGLDYPTFFAFDDITYQVNATPEPATLAILGLGLAGLGLVRRRK